MIDSIMAMGRIFDDAAGSHSVNRLFAIAAGNLGLFSKEALAIRKQGNEPEPPYWLDEYLEDVFEPSSMDEFKPLRKQVAISVRSTLTSIKISVTGAWLITCS